MKSERDEFYGINGQRLAARLDLPEGPVRAYGLFAHCFTCGKDTFPATRIARALTMHGIGMFRFDFTGLGFSEGDFAETNFSSNVADLIAAANHLRATRRAPNILVGHSLGGTAVLSAAAEIPEVSAVATIAAPSDPDHVTGLFRETIDKINLEGEALVQLAGRQFRITREFLVDVAEQRLTEKIERLGKPLLVMHSPLDTTVGIENAALILTAAKHPKSFISLDNADHLLSHRSDAKYVADMIAIWSERYIASHDSR